MNRDVNSIIKEIDWFDFLFELNLHKIRIDLDVKTWDDFYFKNFPKLFLFNFSFLENKQLTSLNGCPKEFFGSFYCSNNKLTSLEGAPEKVGGDFVCRDNQLTSLKGAPQKIGGNFYCSYNKLTSLEGAPMEIGEYFFYLGNSDLPKYKIKAYQTFLNLPDSEKELLTKDGHYFPTKEWEYQFK